MAKKLTLKWLGLRILVRIESGPMAEMLASNFELLQSPFSSVEKPDLTYSLRSAGDGFLLESNNGKIIECADNYAAYYFLEKSITVDAQLMRPELFFVHAAALEHDGRALLLAAEPGSGKSTTCWGLVQQGFGYLSDELAPISPQTLDVHPYPHALCFKSQPPAPFGLSTFWETENTLHVPASALDHVVRSPVRLGALLFNRYDPAAEEPSLTPIAAGEASARLYANGLNQLAHGNAGLEVAASIARQVPAFLLTTTRALDAVANLVRTLPGVPGT